jgi:hypothetical protein
MGASERLEAKLTPIGRALLEPGEELRGTLVATEAKTFGGGPRAVVVTNRRLLVQPVDRKWGAKGKPLSLLPGDIAEMRISGLGDHWYNTAISMVANAGFEVRLKTGSGDKLKLMFMGGEGSLFGSAGGGETQARGVAALVEWLRAARSSTSD